MESRKDERYGTTMNYRCETGTAVEAEKQEVQTQMADGHFKCTVIKAAE